MVCVELSGQKQSQGVLGSIGGKSESTFTIQVEMHMASLMISMLDCMWHVYFYPHYTNKQKRFFHPLKGMMSIPASTYIVSTHLHTCTEKDNARMKCEMTLVRA